MYNLIYTHTNGDTPTHTHIYIYRGFWWPKISNCGHDSKPTFATSGSHVHVSTCLCWTRCWQGHEKESPGQRDQEQAYKDKDRLEQCAKEHPGDISKVKGMAREMLNRNLAKMWPLTHHMGGDSWNGGTPSHHPFLDEIFPNINHLFWGSPHFWKPPYIVYSICEYWWILPRGCFCLPSRPFKGLKEKTCWCFRLLLWGESAKNITGAMVGFGYCVCRCPEKIGLKLCEHPKLTHSDSDSCWISPCSRLELGVSFDCQDPS